MTEARLLKRLASTDAYPAGGPMPDEIWTHAIALQAVERSADMQTGASEPRRPQRAGWLVPALAGAAAVIVAIVGAWAVFTGDDKPDVTNDVPVPTTVLIVPSPLEVTGAFNEAVSSADWPALRALFTDTATQQFILPTETIPSVQLMAPMPVGGDLTSLGLFDWNGDGIVSEFDGLARQVAGKFPGAATTLLAGRYAGTTTTLLSCSEVDAVTVACDEVLEGYAFKSRLYMRTWTFTVVDGLITNVLVDLSLSEVDPIDGDAVAAYEAWVMGNRPELTRDLFTFGGQLRIEPGTIEIHRQLVTEWQAQR